MIRLVDPNYNMTGAEFLGSAILFYIFLPSLAIMGIWSVIHDLKRDADWERGGDSFANDYHGHGITMPDPPSFKGWRDPIPKKDLPGRLVQHRERYGK